MTEEVARQRARRRQLLLKHEARRRPHEDVDRALIQTGQDVVLRHADHHGIAVNRHRAAEAVEDLAADAAQLIQLREGRGAGRLLLHGDRRRMRRRWLPAWTTLHGA